MAIPVYIFFALVAAISFSLNAILSKLVTKYAIESKYVLIFYSHILNLIYLPFLFFATSIKNPFHGIIPLLLFSLAFFIGSLFIITVLYRYDISALHPFFHFQTIFSVSLAYLVLGERYSPIVYIWILLIIIGGALVSVDEKFKSSILVSKNFLVFLIGIFFLAISDIYVKKTLVYMNVYNLKFWSGILLSVMALTMIPFMKKRIYISKKKAVSIAAAGLFGFLGTIFLFSAFAYNITLSQPIAMSGSLFTLFFSILLSRFKPDLLEHHQRRIYVQRILGALVMIIGAIMIVRT